jgi:hypothetical protein
VRTAEIYASVRGDFGQLSNTDELLLRAACRLLSRGERVRDTDASVRLSSEARRTIESLMRRAAPKRDSEPTLAA